PAELPPREVARSWAMVREEALRVGRDPDRLGVCFSTGVRFEVPSGPRTPFSGSIDQVLDALASHRDVCVDRFRVDFGPRPASEYEQRMRLFAEQIRPALADVVTHA